MKDLQIVLFPNGIIINSKPLGLCLFLESVHLGEELRHCCWEENNLKTSTHEGMPRMGWQQYRAWASPQANPPVLFSLGLQPRNLTVDVSYFKFFFLPFATHIFLPQYPAYTLLTPLKFYPPVFWVFALPGDHGGAAPQLPATWLLPTFPPYSPLLTSRELWQLLSSFVATLRYCAYQLQPAPCNGLI